MNFDPDISRDMSIDIHQESTRLVKLSDGYDDTTMNMEHKDSLGDERDVNEAKIMMHTFANAQQKSTMQSMMDKNERYSYMNDQSA